MHRQNTNVFVSYSHADASLVAPIVKLLRVNDSLVFRDIDDIRPGKRWRSEIARGLSLSHLVVVFWCKHASQSDEVSKELKAAIEQKKDLLPLLLDATPLPPQLGEFQWIDFRGTVGPNHNSIVSSADDVGVRESAKHPVKSTRRLSLAGLALVLVAVAMAVSLWTLEMRGPTHLPTPIPPSISEPQPESHPGHSKTPALPEPPEESASPAPLSSPSSYIIVPIALLLAAALWLTWRLRRRLARRRASKVAKLQPREFERRMASEIETEILRRTASRRDAGA